MYVEVKPINGIMLKADWAQINWIFNLHEMIRTRYNKKGGFIVVKNKDILYKGVLKLQNKLSKQYKMSYKNHPLDDENTTRFYIV